jgi:hypothetical protein
MSWTDTLLVLPLGELGRRFLYCFIGLAAIDFSVCYRTRGKIPGSAAPAGSTERIRHADHRMGKSRVIECSFRSVFFFFLFFL